MIYRSHLPDVEIPISSSHGGEKVVTQSGEVFAVFASPRACVDAAAEVRRALVSHALRPGERVRARMGIQGVRPPRRRRWAAPRFPDS